MREGGDNIVESCVHDSLPLQSVVEGGGLRCGVWNVRGLTSKRNYKLKNSDCVHILKSYDIAMLCETWTNQLSDLSLDGYEHVAVHRTKHPRARRDSGGLVLYYKSEMAKHLSILKTTGDV